MSVNDRDTNAVSVYLSLQDIHLAKRFYDMAAETSADAKVPVMIALSRLNFYFFVEYLKDVSSSVCVGSFLLSFCSSLQV